MTALQRPCMVSGRGGVSSTLVLRGGIIFTPRSADWICILSSQK